MMYIVSFPREKSGFDGDELGVTCCCIVVVAVVAVVGLLMILVPIALLLPQHDFFLTALYYAYLLWTFNTFITFFVFFAHPHTHMTT